MGPRLPSWLAWALALFEIVKAFALTFKYAGILIRGELDGTAPDDRRRQAAKKAAEQERKATFLDRAKADREALFNAHKADMAELKARQEQGRAKLMADARLMAERQEKLRKLWETTEPKSRKWDYKI